MEIEYVKLRLHKLSILILGLIFSGFLNASSLVKLSGNDFLTVDGLIPVGCFAQLMTELNGDNSVAAVFISRPYLRGCLEANFPYPGGDESKVLIREAQELKENTFGVEVCTTIDGSMGTHCDRILIGFSENWYLTKDGGKAVLTMTKLGNWSLKN